MNFQPSDVSYILSPLAIRERSAQILNRCKQGDGYFQFHEEKVKETVDFICDVIKDNYPDFKIPFHSRWGHFSGGGINRLEKLNSLLEKFSTQEKLESKIDLVIVSVLLDAGAGPQWSYEERGKSISRSEGLGVASINMFFDGVFSSDSNNPLRVDAEALINFSRQDLEKGFQVSEENPLVGIDGRVHLLNALGKQVKNSKIFKNNRPSGLMNELKSQYGDKLQAVDLLSGVLLSLGPIWPARIKLGDRDLGDVWKHSQIGSQSDTSCLIPFHKLSQWLSYSMMEPMMECGFVIENLDGMTGLAEYRNGGLFVDMGVITLKDSSLYQQAHEPKSDLVIEWRALTIQLLDIVAKQVREKLGLSEADFPLVKVLEGGTWWAGRRIAKKLRDDGTPPIKIKSDGTAF